MSHHERFDPVSSSPRRTWLLIYSSHSFGWPDGDLISSFQWTLAKIGVSSRLVLSCLETHGQDCDSLWLVLIWDQVIKNRKFVLQALRAPITSNFTKRYAHTHIDRHTDRHRHSSSKCFGNDDDKLLRFLLSNNKLKGKQQDFCPHTHKSLKPSAYERTLEESSWTWALACFAQGPLSTIRQENKLYLTHCLSSQGNLK